MPMENKPLNIIFVAGDPSGDEHAAAVIGRLKTVLPNARLSGIGGPCMQEAGFEALLPFEPFNRMGIAEVLLHLPFFLRAKSFLIKQLREKRPAALVCVDYPGFNIPLMKAARGLGIPVVWYIVPQVWAWKKKRAEVLGKFASFVAVVFPFEVEYFRQYPSPVEFVGHPLVELLDKVQPAVAGLKPPAAEKNGTIRLALVPGSRPQEIAHLLPPMIDAAIRLKKTYPSMSVTVSRARGLSAELFGTHTGRFETQFPGCMKVSDAPLFELVRGCDCAIVTSGTATLQTALAGVPLVVAYRTSAVTYLLLKSMVRLPYIGLPNIVAGERIVPECIQSGATGEKLAAEVRRFLDSKELSDTTKEKLAALRARLGGKKPSVEVASAIRAVALRSTQAPA
jgi:lipid-A-disaccharide synthase